jgi:hypothetical protein
VTSTQLLRYLLFQRRRRLPAAFLFVRAEINHSEWANECRIVPSPFPHYHDSALPQFRPEISCFKFET